MQYKNTQKRLFQMLGTVATVFFLCAQFFVQSHIFHPQTGKNISFDSAKEIINNGPLQETRKTIDGHIIQRFFTGISTLPYIDYLVIETQNKTKELIPLRKETQSIESQTSFFEIPFFLEQNNISTKKIFFPIVSWFSSVGIIFYSIFLFVKASEFLLFAALSRNKLWILYQQFRC